MLGPRGLYPTLHQKDISDFSARVLWLTHFSDGGHDLLDIARRANCRLTDLAEIAEIMVEKELLRPSEV
jgi:aminopeptidase-like protein